MTIINTNSAYKSIRYILNSTRLCFLIENNAGSEYLVDDILQKKKI